MLWPKSRKATNIHVVAGNTKLTRKKIHWPIQQLLVLWQQGTSTLKFISFEHAINRRKFPFTSCFAQHWSPRAPEIPCVLCKAVNPMCFVQGWPCTFPLDTPNLAMTPRTTQCNVIRALYKPCKIHDTQFIPVIQWTDYEYCSSLSLYVSKEA